MSLDISASNLGNKHIFNNKQYQTAKEMIDFTFRKKQSMTCREDSFENYAFIKTQDSSPSNWTQKTQNCKMIASSVKTYICTFLHERACLEEE